jgi:hypothetical protein
MGGKNDLMLKLDAWDGSWLQGKGLYNSGENLPSAAFTPKSPQESLLLASDLDLDIPIIRPTFLGSLKAIQSAVAFMGLSLLFIAGGSDLGKPGFVLPSLSVSRGRRATGLQLLNRRDPTPEEEERSREAQRAMEEAEKMTTSDILAKLYNEIEAKVRADGFVETSRLAEVKRKAKSANQVCSDDATGEDHDAPVARSSRCRHADCAGVPAGPHHADHHPGGPALAVGAEGGGEGGPDNWGGGGRSGARQGRGRGRGDPDGGSTGGGGEAAGGGAGGGERPPSAFLLGPTWIDRGGGAWGRGGRVGRRSRSAWRPCVPRRPGSAISGRRSGWPGWKRGSAPSRRTSRGASVRPRPPGQR